MSSAAKQYIAGVLCIVSAVVMIVCVWRMIPYGLAGNVDKVKAWFGLMVITFIVSVSAGIIYYYNRSRAAGDADLDSMRTEVNALSFVGRKPVESAAASSGLKQPGEKKGREGV